MRRGVVEALLEKIAHRKVHFIARDHLPRDGYRKPLLEMYLPRLRLNRLGNQAKERAFARAILAHERRLRATAEAEGDVVEHHLLRPIFIGHVFESKDRFGCHFKTLPYARQIAKISSRIAWRHNYGRALS